MTKPSKARNIQIPVSLIRKLLTQSEIRMLKNRFSIFNLAEGGLSIRAIAQKAGVGTDTVVRTLRLIEDTGLKNTLNYTNGKIKPKTSWIFGKSNE